MYVQSLNRLGILTVLVRYLSLVALDHWSGVGCRFLKYRRTTLYLLNTSVDLGVSHCESAIDHRTPVK